MPPATTADRVTFYGFQPGEAFPDRFIRLLPEVKPVHDVYLLNEQLEALLSTACLWQLTAHLTAQGHDLFGVERPYDCDPLVDFLLTGPDLHDPRYVHYRHLEVSDRPTLHTLIERVLLEPIFPNEKEMWGIVLQRLNASSGPIVTVYCR